MNPTNNHNASPRQATLRLSNKQGLNDLLNKVDLAVTNIYDRRKITADYFREEMFIAKNKSNTFARWNLEKNGKLSIAPPPPPANQSPSQKQVQGIFHDNSSYEVKEYNSKIRFPFKSAVANLKNTERALKWAIRYQGEVEISADILNNMDFFGTNAECVKKLDIYCKQQVDEFIRQRIDNPQAG